MAPRDGAEIDIPVSLALLDAVRYATAAKMGPRTHTPPLGTHPTAVYDKSFAFSNGRDLRAALLVNPRRSTRRADKVDQMARGLCLPASKHLIFTSAGRVHTSAPTHC